MSNAGTEPLRLYEHGHERLEVFPTGAPGQIPQRINSGLAHAHLKIYQLQFVAEFRVNDLQLLCDSQNRLIQTKADLHANHEQIEPVWQSLLKTMLAATNPPKKPHFRKKDSRDHRRCKN